MTLTADSRSQENRSHPRGSCGVREAPAVGTIPATRRTSVLWSLPWEIDGVATAGVRGSLVAIALARQGTVL